MQEIRLRCTFCIMQYGVSYLTSNLKLKQIGNTDYLTCRRHSELNYYDLRGFRYDHSGHRRIKK